MIETAFTDMKSERNRRPEPSEAHGINHNDAAVVNSWYKDKEATGKNPEATIDTFLEYQGLKGGF